MGYLKTIAAATALFAHIQLAQAGEFSIAFDWDGLARCTDGMPNTVDNPRFVLGYVPPGTESIEFNMVDRDNSDYYHGGGTVVYLGQKIVKPGAFTYKSPCPSRGRRTYEWTAVARGAEGSSRPLGRAKASRFYPE